MRIGAIGSFGSVIKSRQPAHVSAAVTSDAFLGVRTKVKNPVSNDTFVSSFFQNNENNFERRASYEIGDLKDTAHNNISLQQEADAIKVKRDKYGTMTPKISEVPSLTVITYGQNGTVSDWSNNGNIDSDGNGKHICLNIKQIL